MKCPQCQTLLESDATFCTNCGQKVEVVPPQAKSQKRGGCASVFACISVLFVLVALAGFAYFGYQYAKSEGLIDELLREFGSRAVSVPGSNSSGNAPPKSTRSTQVPVSSEPVLSDFAGTWTIENSNNTVNLRTQGGQVVAQVNDGGELRLGFLKGSNGYSIHGSYSDATESYPASAELSRDRKKLTLTLAPPASEYWVVNMYRSSKH